MVGLNGRIRQGCRVGFDQSRGESNQWWHAHQCAAGLQKELSAVIDEAEEFCGEVGLLGNDVFIFQLISGDVLRDGQEPQMKDGLLAKNKSKDKLEVRNLMEKVTMAHRDSYFRS